MIFPPFCHSHHHSESMPSDAQKTHLQNLKVQKFCSNAKECIALDAWKNTYLALQIWNFLGPLVLTEGGCVPPFPNSWIRPLFTFVTSVCHSVKAPGGHWITIAHPCDESPWVVSARCTLASRNAHNDSTLVVWHGNSSQNNVKPRDCLHVQRHFALFNCDRIGPYTCVRSVAS